MTFRKTLCGLALTGLAACGGGGGIGQKFAPLGSGPITEAELRDVGEALEGLADLTASDISFSTPAASATYNGFVEIEQTFTDYYLGRVTLNADFASNQVSGRAGDFAIIRDTSPATATDISQMTFDTLDVLAGTLPISNGTIGTVVENGQTAKSMSATMAGNLTGSAGTYGVDATLDGVFVSVAGQDAVIGLVSGTKTEPGAGTTTLDGAYAAFK